MPYLNKDIECNMTNSSSLCRSAYTSPSRLFSYMKDYVKRQILSIIKYLARSKYS